jgi:predicted nucleotidyltransferase
VSETEVLQFIRDRLKARFEVKKLVLFGSRATGTALPDSDYDVLVVAESDIPFIPRQGLARMDLGPRDFALDLLVYTPAEALEAAKIVGSAVYWAEIEGKEYVA